MNEDEVEQAQEGEAGFENEVRDAGGEARWLQGKSEMLDEVNQLVEMMMAEKSNFQEKIVALETEVDKYHKQTEQLKVKAERKEKDVVKLKFEQSLLKDKNSRQQTTLHTTLNKTRKELRNVQQQVKSLTQSLEAEKQCHMTLRSKLDSVEKCNHTLSHDLDQQQRENEKLTQLFQSTQENIVELKLQHEKLQSQLKNSKQREQKASGEILALRGRLTRCQRAHEELQTHCSKLEKEIESHTHQTSVTRAKRTKEEIRLAKECRKKDEMLTSYLQKLSADEEQQQTMQKEMRKLQMNILSKEKEKKELISRLEERENCELTEKLNSLTTKLESSQRELLQVRADVKRQNERERERGGHLLKVKQEEIDRLHTQLVSAWQQHQTAMTTAETQWTQRLIEARSDYERLKQVSTQRCVELAREVWELKSSLESQH